MKRQSFVIIIVILAALGAGIYAFLFADYNAAVPDQSKAMNNTRAGVPEQTTERFVNIYMIGVDGDQLVLRPLEITIDASDEPVEAAMNAFVEQQDTSDLGNPIPEEARIENVTVDGDMATIDFSIEFVDGFAGGSEEETLLIQAIAKTVGQFDHINKIMLKADGKPVNTLGHLDISEPIMIDDAGLENGAGN